LQDQPVISFDPRSMWENMSWPARLVHRRHD
jgi:hypothetical protein